MQMRRKKSKRCLLFVAQAADVDAGMVMRRGAVGAQVAAVVLRLRTILSLLLTKRYQTVELQLVIRLLLPLSTKLQRPFLLAGVLHNLLRHQVLLLPQQPISNMTAVRHLGRPVVSNRNSRAATLV